MPNAVPFSASEMSKIILGTIATRQSADRKSQTQPYTTYLMQKFVFTYMQKLIKITLLGCSAETRSMNMYSRTVTIKKVVFGYIYCLTYLLQPAAFLKKLTGSQLVKKFPAFYGTRRFITVFTSARHLSLS
jgi:hypothetical protein